MWFDGYWWWVCNTGQPTAAQKFALWGMSAAGSGTVLPGSVVTSNALTAGTWNYVPLPAPIPLAIGATYLAATGLTGGFPDTNSQYGAGGPYSAGITQGPLFAYSDLSGTKPTPTGTAQGTFSTAGTDPSIYVPVQGSNSFNAWMDVQVDTSAPAGTSFRLWPNYPIIPGEISQDSFQESFGTEFRLSQACTLNNIWFYSPPGVTVLPSRCAIWDVSTQSVVPNTDNAAPKWSGVAGSGWVASSYTGVVLAAGDYKTTVYSGGGSGSGAWYYQENVDYFSTGPGANGITAGPLSCPNTSSATPPGNSTYQLGPFSYPNTFDTVDGGENRWVDVEVTPGGVIVKPPPPKINSGAFLAFFP
jgi:hypothetical protein